MSAQHTSIPAKDGGVIWRQPRDPEADASKIDPAKGRIWDPSIATENEDTQQCELNSQSSELRAVEASDRDLFPEFAPAGQQEFIPITPMENPDEDQRCP